MDALTPGRVHFRFRRNPQMTPVQAPPSGRQMAFIPLRTISKDRENKPEKEWVDRVRARKVRGTHPETSRNSTKIARISIRFSERAQPESIPYGAGAFHLGEGIVFVPGLNTPKFG